MNSTVKSVDKCRYFGYVGPETMDARSVLVYDQGEAAPYSVDGLVACARRAVSSVSEPIVVKKVSDLDLESEAAFTGVLAFCMPGGRSTDFRKALQTGDRVKNLVNFVRSGGIYLSVCGGSYLACTNVCFDLGGVNERIVRDGGLNFFSGIGRGPLFPNFSYASSDVHAVPICPTEQQSDEIVTYYCGGCWFEEIEHQPNTVEVLAHYRDRDARPAIIRCKVDKGQAILCGPHLEYDPSVAQKQYDECVARCGSYEGPMESEVGQAELKASLKRIVDAGAAGQDFLVLLLSNALRKRTG
ncbi:MAG: hypothetical protein LBP65_03200 [Puniceicoccales bacterium]|jgi:biotin--protein ligase|nr:hypothetical protein [Puniceicoccales bacterium]